MDTQNLISILDKVRRSYGNDIFMNVGKLCSYTSDMAEGYITNQEIALIKVGYHVSEPEILSLIRELRSKGNRVAECVAIAKRAMLNAFMPTEAASAILEVILVVFGETPKTESVAYSHIVEIHVQELIEALTYLDDKYKDALWRDGRKLSGLLSDYNPSLVVERQLIERVYSVCEKDIRKLVRQIVKRESIEVQIVNIQQSLRNEFVADEYIDSFLSSVLGLFGTEYKSPLVKVSVKSTPISVNSKNNQNIGTSSVSPTGNSNTQQGSSTVVSTSAGSSSGTSSSNTTNGSAVQAGSGQVTTKKKRSIILPLILVCIIAFFILPKMLNSDDNINTQNTSETESDTVEKNVTKEPLYKPQLSPSLGINTVESTVYGDNVTDLHNYERYEGRGYKFTFGYPVSLYEKLEFVEGELANDADQVIFTGTDGSYLKYLKQPLTHRYTNTEWREEFVGIFTSGMTNVNMIYQTEGEFEYSSGKKVGSFFLTAKEASLDVYIVGLLNIEGGLADYMILKVPASVSDEDRMVKGYYAETLCALAEFFNTNKYKINLRSYEDYCADPRF